MLLRIVFNPFTGKFDYVSIGSTSSASINAGTTFVDFGSGGSNAQAVITGQTGILSGSVIDAWLSPSAPTADHSIDEHVAEGLFITAGNTVPGVGFTVYAVTRNVALRGKWNVAWSWS